MTYAGNARRGRVGFQPIPVEERLAAKSRREGDCIVFTGFVNPAGYAHIYSNGRIQAAHRVAYELAKGTIPAGLVLDHLCRNRRCINPDHLEPVTHRVNIMRGTGPSAQNAGRTHCIYGHPFDGDNVRVWKTTRRCVICVRRRKQERRAREKEASAC